MQSMRVVEAVLILFCLLPFTACRRNALGEPNSPKTDKRGIDLSRLAQELERHMVSWPRLKRHAGYFTEKHVYKGGLYKEAIDEEFEFYQCLEDNKQYCTSWTAHEESKGEVEHGTCECTKEGEHYCKSWHCYQQELAFDVNCGDFGCQDELQFEDTTCHCKNESTNHNYCEIWNCEENGSDGNHEEEVYTCLEEDESGNYCYRWNGTSASVTEIESSACRCAESGQSFCKYWICKERGIERCQAHAGWCNLHVAVEIGGGLGAAFIVVGLGIVPPDASRSERLFTLAFVFFFGCLPWLAGVLIWGGIYALPWVAMIWASTLALSICWIYWVTREGSSSMKPSVAPVDLKNDP